MDFIMGSVEEAKVAAQQADNVGGNYVSDPGAYPGKITKAYFQEFKSGAGGLQIEADVEKDGEKKQLKILIITKTRAGVSYYEKDGNKLPLPGMNQITGGLMPVASKQTLPSVKNSEGKITYPSLEGVSMGFLVNIRITDGKKAGQTYKNTDLVAFYDPKTNKTGSEILNNTEAKKKVKIEEGLKVIDETTKQQTPSVDPFADNEDSSPFNDNPFEDKSDNTDKEVSKSTENTKTTESAESDPDEFWTDQE